MFGDVNFNVKYYVLSQIFYKEIGWLHGKVQVKLPKRLKHDSFNSSPFT